MPNLSWKRNIKALPMGAGRDGWPCRPQRASLRSLELGGCLWAAALGVGSRRWEQALPSPPRGRWGTAAWRPTMISFHFPLLHLCSNLCLLICLLPRGFWYPCVHPASFLPPFFLPLSIPGTCSWEVLHFGSISPQPLLLGPQFPPTRRNRKGSVELFAFCRAWQIHSSSTNDKRSLCPWFWNALGINLVCFHWSRDWLSLSGFFTVILKFKKFLRPPS